MDVAGARQEYGVGLRVVSWVGGNGHGIYSEGVWLQSEIASLTPYVENNEIVFKLIEAHA